MLDRLRLQLLTTLAHYKLGPDYEIELERSGSSDYPGLAVSATKPFDGYKLADDQELADLFYFFNARKLVRFNVGVELHSDNRLILAEYGAQLPQVPTEVFGGDGEDDGMLIDYMKFFNSYFTNKFRSLDGREPSTVAGKILGSLDALVIKMKSDVFDGVSPGGHVYMTAFPNRDVRLGLSIKDVSGEKGSLEIDLRYVGNNPRTVGTLCLASYLL